MYLIHRESGIIAFFVNLRNLCSKGSSVYISYQHKEYYKKYIENTLKTLSLGKRSSIQISQENGAHCNSCRW